MLPIDHCWIKTDSVSAGMASSPQCRRGVGDDYEMLYKTKVYISDHSCESSKRCMPIDDVDEECVNKELAIGKYLGRFHATNNCRSLANDVIAKCSKNKLSPYFGHPNLK